jgi:N-acetylglutamate synthase-like GNAT family acetyltransferase
MPGVVEVSELREATTAEVDRLRALMTELSSERSQLDQVAVARVLEHPGTTVLVAREGKGEVVGTLTLQVCPTLTCDQARIEDVVVLERPRARGVGRRLVEAGLPPPASAAWTRLT